jgi:hypothetical protein
MPLRGLGGNEQMYDNEDYEPQEHDELAVKVHELIKAEVDAKIIETVDSLAYQIKLNTEYRKTINELQAKIRNFEPDIKKALLEKEKEVKRTIFDGFVIGDKVYYAEGKKTKDIICKVCEGKRKVAAQFNGENIEIGCPSCCNGRPWDRMIYNYEPKSDVIEWLNIEMNSSNKWIKFRLSRDVDKKEPKEVFRTLEECQAYCDEMNKKEQDKLAN